MPHYSVVFDAQTQQASVRLCLSEAHAEVAFAADSGWAMRFVHEVRRGGDRAVDEAATAGAHELASRRCPSYQADIGAIAAQHKQDVGWKLGDDLVAAPRYGCCARRPRRRRRGCQRQAAGGWSISAPWHELGRDGEIYVSFRTRRRTGRQPSRSDISRRNALRAGRQLRWSRCTASMRTAREAARLAPRIARRAQRLRSPAAGRRRC